MRSSRDGRDSRGSSILASILLMALVGVGSVFGTDFGSRENQLAASPIAALGTTPSTVYTLGSSKPGEKNIVSDTPEPGTASCIGRSGGVTTVPVQYACYQKGDVSKIKELTQTGSGFEYFITVDSKGILEIKPNPLIPGASYCTLPAPPMCATENRPAIASLSTEKNRVVVDKKAQKAVAEDL